MIKHNLVKNGILLVLDQGTSSVYSSIVGRYLDLCSRGHALRWRWPRQMKNATNPFTQIKLLTPSTHISAYGLVLGDSDTVVLTKWIVAIKPAVRISSLHWCTLCGIFTLFPKAERAIAFSNKQSSGGFSRSFLFVSLIWCCTQ